MVPLVVNSAGRPRFTTIHNPERVKLVATTPYCILLLAPFYDFYVFCYFLSMLSRPGPYAGCWGSSASSEADGLGRGPTAPADGCGGFGAVEVRSGL